MSPLNTNVAKYTGHEGQVREEMLDTARDCIAFDDGVYSFAEGSAGKRAKPDHWFQSCVVARRAFHLSGSWTG